MTKRLTVLAPLLSATVALSSAAAQQFAGGVHLGGPVRASVAVGAMFGDRHAEEARGVFALVEPGLRGGRVSLGYEVSRGSLGSYLSARMSLLRTWRVEPERSYGGLEFMVLPLFAIGGRVGAFVPMSGSRRVLWIGDLSLGL